MSWSQFLKSGEVEYILVTNHTLLTLMSHSGMCILLVAADRASPIMEPYQPITAHVQCNIGTLLFTISVQVKPI